VRDYDFIVVGSGFGGSVSALRLAEKGYSVAVLERGKRFRAEDFPKTNWNIRKFLWLPKLFCYGIQAITLLRDVLILHGSGVGGGSLVYSNVLLEPPDDVFSSPGWPRGEDWRRILTPHYETAKRMLGATTARCQTELDDMLESIARDLDRGDTYHPTDVGVFFGEPDETVPDPYFNGEGPERTGCNHCGGCMSGCRYNAKNTLDKNYLYLAEKKGVTVIAETEVTDIRPTDPTGYEIHTKKVTDFVLKRTKTFRTRGIILAGGVLGTVPLLFRCRDRGSLSHISPKLGTFVRTNSEALVGATARKRSVDYSKGISIASGFYPNDDTHIEMVRYGAGHDFMGTLGTLLTGGGGRVPRWIRLIGNMFRHPLDFARLIIPFDWARRTGILLVMQPLHNYMRLTLKRRWWWPFSKVVDSKWSSEAKVPKFFPVANDTAERLAQKMDGIPGSLLPEVLFHLTSTAHILGGCPMGESPEEGVIDPHGRLFGYENFYIADGSIIPVNLSVNPSLTITALSEWVMSHVPAKDQ
jgi:cholesterol oxidase